MILSPENEKILREGIRMLTSFQCEHDPPCEDKGAERGGVCNSCWARWWAERIERRLLREA